MAKDVYLKSYYKQQREVRLNINIACQKCALSLDVTNTAGYFNALQFPPVVIQDQQRISPNTTWKKSLMKLNEFVSRHVSLCAGWQMMRYKHLNLQKKQMCKPLNYNFFNNRDQFSYFMFFDP